MESLKPRHREPRDRPKGSKNAGGIQREERRKPSWNRQFSRNIMRDKVTDCLKNKNTLNPVQRLMDLRFRVDE